MTRRDFLSPVLIPLRTADTRLAESCTERDGRIFGRRMGKGRSDDRISWSRGRMWVGRGLLFASRQQGG